MLTITNLGWHLREVEMGKGKHNEIFHNLGAITKPRRTAAKVLVLPDDAINNVFLI